MIIRPLLYFPAPSGGAAWNPLDLTNLLAWWDASDSSSITESGGLVSQLNDKSGNNLHMTQGIGSAQPSITTDGLGYNVIQFITGKWLNISHTSIYDVPKSSNSVFIACETTTIDSTTSGRMFCSRGTSGLRWAVNQRLSGYYLNHDPSFSPILYTGVTPTTNGALGYTYNNSIGDANLYFNGSLTDSSVTPVSPVTDVNICVFGAQDNNGVNANFNGYLKEMVITNDELSLSDRQKLEGYLAHKWGVEGSLPIGHPYKSAPPTV